VKNLKSVLQKPAQRKNAAMTLPIAPTAKGRKALWRVLGIGTQSDSGKREQNAHLEDSQSTYLFLVEDAKRGE